MASYLDDPERWQQYFIQGTGNPYAGGGTMEEQIAQQLRAVDPSNIPPAMSDRDRAIMQASQSTVGAQSQLANQQAYADMLRGTAMPQGKEVGPSGIYVNNIWDSAEAGLNRALGGYMSGQLKQKYADIDKTETEKAEGIQRLAAIQQDIENKNDSELLGLKKGEAKEYAEFTDGKNFIRGYKEAGIGYDDKGNPVPDGYREYVAPTRSSGSNFQSITENDAFGNVVATRFDKGSGEYGVRTFIDGTPWTEEEAKRRGGQQASQAGAVTSAKETSKTNVEEAVKAGEKINDLSGVLAETEKALNAINEGANSGPVQSRLPSFKASTIKLENARDKMALYDIGSYTFGSLSEAEGDWLKKASIPPLDEDELKPFLENRAEGLRRAINAEKYIEEMRLNGLQPDRAVIDQIKYSGGFRFSDEEE